MLQGLDDTQSTGRVVEFRIRLKALMQEYGISDETSSHGSNRGSWRMDNRDFTAYQRFFIRPRPGQRSLIEADIQTVIGGAVIHRPAPDGALLKPTILKPGKGRYLIPMRWLSGEVITIDNASTAQWFWLDADIPFNGSQARRLALILTQHAGIACVAEDNTRGAAHGNAEAWIIDEAHYLLQPD
ncbi:hypothetical protein QO259_00755 [Salinicola sp. JS01]|uniref:hypothetical protein n=1 Tax=Salinicola sp. JS01 TaxID=3050071 RepID=UPI00255BFA28|nr:hypothetical protein [Salinicola sp. JS01]WIX33222.1 hypothetical protein QO259_00755 [Salinicola sp. JS01]